MNADELKAEIEESLNRNLDVLIEEDARDAGAEAGRDWSADWVRLHPKRVRDMLKACAANLAQGLADRTVSAADAERWQGLSAGMKIRAVDYAELRDRWTGAKTVEREHCAALVDILADNKMRSDDPAAREAGRCLRMAAIAIRARTA